MSAASNCALLSARNGEAYPDGSVPATDTTRSRSRITSEKAADGTLASGAGPLPARNRTSPVTTSPIVQPPASG
jgi:hypothetical protein